MRPRISSTPTSRASSHADKSVEQRRMCAGPCRSSAEVVITTSAPASRYFTTSSAPLHSACSPRARLECVPTARRSTSSGRRISGGRAELQSRSTEQLHEIDVRLVEPVEQHQPVGARRVELANHMPDRAEIRAELDRDRDRHGPPAPLARCRYSAILDLAPRQSRSEGMK